MKLAYLLRYFPTFSETFVYDEINALEPLVGPPLVWALDPGPEAALDAGLRGMVDRCQVVPRSHHPSVSAHAALRARAARRQQRGVERRWSSWGGRLKDLHRAMWLGSQLRRAEVTQLHVHFAAEMAEVAWVVRKVQGIPYSLTVHARDLFCPRPSLAHVLAGARVVVAISEYNRRHLLGLGVRDLERRLVVVRMGVADAAPVAQRDPGEGALQLLAVGRLVEKKGLDVLVEALGRLRREGGAALQLDVIGDGPQGPALRRRAEELGLGSAVRWLGAVPRERVLQRYTAGVDLLVAPSRVAADGDMDGIPVALMEAMVRQVPVISTALSGIPELVQHGRSGLLVPPGDPAALAEAIRSMAASPAARARLAQEGRRQVLREHRLEAQARLLVEALE